MAQVCKARCVAQCAPTDDLIEFCVALACQVEVGAARKYTGMFQCIAHVARNEGLVPLWRGCLMRIARVAPGMGITFTVVEQVTARFG